MPALTPVIAYQMLNNVRLVPDVCVAARERVRSVCLVTRGMPLEEVRSVSLDVSSRTSVALTKIIFCEFLGFEPVWQDARPDIEAMLDAQLRPADRRPDARLSVPAAASADPPFRTFDLAELWRSFTGLGFVFAMWMTRTSEAPIDLAAVRDEGLLHIDEDERPIMYGILRCQRKN